MIKLNNIIEKIKSISFSRLSEHPVTLQSLKAGDIIYYENRMNESLKGYARLLEDPVLYLIQHTGELIGQIHPTSIEKHNKVKVKWLSGSSMGNNSGYLFEDKVLTIYKVLPYIRL